MKTPLSQRKFTETLTKINTILLSILIVVVGLDLLKEIFREDPDLVYPLFYTFLLFGLVTYVQHLFFGYYDENIAPLLENLQKDLQANITEKTREEQKTVATENISTTETSVQKSVQRSVETSIENSE